MTSLGTGMHALSSVISTNTAGAPNSPIVSVTQSTMACRIEAVTIGCAPVYVQPLGLAPPPPTRPSPSGWQPVPGRVRLARGI